MAVDLVVHNGIVVTPTNKFRGGVAIDNGIIVAVGTDAVLPDAKKVLDAGGSYIFSRTYRPTCSLSGPWT